MSSLITTLIVVGVIGILVLKRCEWLDICSSSSSSSPSHSSSSSHPSSSHNKSSSSSNNLGPANFGDEGADLGFGFSKSGGPILSKNGRSKNGQPRAGDNSNNKNLTIAMLPGPCETKRYKGLIQYKHAGLSASADTCNHAKQYFLYKYGLGVKRASSSYTNMERISI